MKEQYVGDVGDFGKVLLLKSLASVGFKIGVNWVLTRPDNGSDGKHRDYPWYGIRHRANNPLYEKKRTPDSLRDCLACCSEEDSLRRIAILAKKKKEERKIQDLEELLTTMLLTAPIFFTRNYDDSAPRAEKNEAALRELKAANLVFFDPDNGLCFQDAGVQKSPKHIYLDELARFWAARQSLLVYHHWGRQSGGNRNCMDGIASKLGRALTGSKLFQYQFRRGSGRTYFLIAHPDHAESIREANKEIARAIEPLTYTVKEWRRKASPCLVSHIWQFS